jgi:large subunit ribosomal protein L13
MAKRGAVEQKWLLVDATDKIVGRLASEIAVILMGKHRPTYTPHVDTGDFVVVVNAEKIRFTGKKMEGKLYRHHTEYPGGLISIPAQQLLATYPDRAIRRAVWGMLPKNVLGREMLLKLKVYGSDKHPHTAQKPEALSL